MAPPPIHALLLLKDPARAKTRLAGVLSENQRRALAKKMYRHVLEELRHTDGIARVAVMSPEPPPLPPGVHWLKDSAGEFNRSIAGAIRTLKAQGARQVLVLPADLPLLSRAELEGFIGFAGEYDMVIAPDETESGTNALLLTAGAGFQPGFGVNSFNGHLAQANKLGLKTKIVKTPGLAFDLDDEGDWRRFRAEDAAFSREPIKPQTHE